MPIPFILGLIIGGGAVLAYNKRKEIGSLFQQEECGVKGLLNKGKDMATDLKDTLIATKDTILEAKDSIAQKKDELSQQRSQEKEEQC